MFEVFYCLCSRRSGSNGTYSFEYPTAEEARKEARANAGNMFMAAAMNMQTPLCFTIVDATENPPRFLMGEMNGEQLTAAMQKKGVGYPNSKEMVDYILITPRI